MSINLGNYADVGKTITPKEATLNTAPSEGAIISQGINDVNKVVTEKIEKQNSSKFTIEATRYLTEKQVYQQQLGEQISSGNLSDKEAKLKWEEFNNQAKARYSTMIPEEYHGKFDQLREVENIKVNQELDQTYQQSVNKRFAVDVEQTYQAQLKQPRDIAIPAMKQVLSDPRIPMDKKAELEYKFNNDYDTNAFVSNINNSEDDNEELGYVSLMLDDPEQSKYLTGEQITAFRSTIKNKMDVNNARAEAEARRKASEQEQALALEEKQRKARLDDFSDDVYSLYPVDPDKAAVIAKEDPKMYTLLTQQKTIFTTYKKGTEDERNIVRNNIMHELESGALDADTATKIMTTLDSIDSEANKQEREDPIGTYNARNVGKGQKPLDDNKMNRIVALEANKKPLIPYTKAELDLKRTQWTSPENKAQIMREFVDNAKRAQDKNKAMYDQLSTMVPQAQIQQYIAYSHLIDVSLPTFDEDGDVVSSSNTPIAVGLMTGAVSKIPTTTVTTKLAEDKVTNPEEARMIRQLYAYYVVKDGATVLEDGKEVLSEDSYKKAIKAGFGENMMDESFSVSPWRSGAGQYFRNDKSSPPLHYPVGVSKFEGERQLAIQVKNFSDFTGVDIQDISSYELREINTGVYGYVDAQGRPLLYGYVSKDYNTPKGNKSISKTRTATQNIPVPFTINISPSNTNNKATSVSNPFTK